VENRVIFDMLGLLGHLGAITASVR
jgi:hypothetical protein